MKKHTHHFVDAYKGIAAFGLDRETDEQTIIYYLQKFSDDTLIGTIVQRMTDEELNEIYLVVNRMLKNHLSDVEYHRLFLKDDTHNHKEG